MFLTPRSILFVVFSLLAAGCDSSGGDPFDPQINPDVPEPVTSGCARRVAPVAHIEPVVSVGDGTAGSCTEESLVAAADLLAEGGTLTFDCGAEHTINLTGALHLSSGADNTLVIDGGGVITLSGQGITRILDLDHYTNLVVQNITLSDGFVAAGSDDGDPVNSGAAIRHPWYGTLRAIDVFFLNNHCESRDAEIGGGAIYAGGLDEAVLSGCVFANNSASNGGGILNRGSTLTIVDTVFFSNEATGRGEAGQYGNGGGVYIDGMNYDTPGDLYVCGAVFEENTANTHGSGMFAYFYEGSAAVIDRSLFARNSFGMEGRGSGGLYHESVHLDLTNSTFSENQGLHAGAFFLASGSDARIENCTFSHNSAVMNGAAIFNGASTGQIKGCTFVGNDADWGPAVFTGESATMSVQNTIFAYNSTYSTYAPLACTSTL
ncbi:right-handed parallel beta-helix repeat-containing protein, partial [Myxococcota bacterium]|nr:right-handed parallel beta-helix repeat-containing protein [Myxococcota bacterium]